MNLPDPALPVPQGLDTRAAWQDAVIWAFRAAAARGARRVWCWDAQFDDWPLDRSDWLETLTAWLHRPQRRLTLLANRYADMRGRHPRFTAWRRDWTHAIDTLRLDEPAAGLPPALVVDDTGIILALHDKAHWRSVAELDPKRAHLLRQQIDALAQRCSPDFPATELGL